MGLNQKNKSRLAVAVALMLSAGISSAQAAGETPEAAIGAAIIALLAIIALAGAGFLTLSSASVGWTVGAKFIKRLAGKA